MSQLLVLQNELESKRNELVELTSELHERVLKGKNGKSLERLSNKINNLIQDIKELETMIKEVETNIIIDGDYVIKETENNITITNDRLQLEAYFIKVNSYKLHRNECTIGNNIYYPNSYERSSNTSAYWIKSRGAIIQSHKEILEEMENVLIENADELNMSFIEIR